MVCEYINFTFPGCHCPALVPICLCPQHLDSNNPAYDPKPDALYVPCRITMLFAGPCVPMERTRYRYLASYHQKPYHPSMMQTSKQAEEIAHCAEELCGLQKPGGEGFHTKLCRYHIVYPKCKEIKLTKVDPDYWPFLEKSCFMHSQIKNGDIDWNLEKVYDLSKRFKFINQSDDIGDEADSMEVDNSDNGDAEYRPKTKEDHAKKPAGKAAKKGPDLVPKKMGEKDGMWKPTDEDIDMYSPDPLIGSYTDPLPTEDLSSKGWNLLYPDSPMEKRKPAKPVATSYAAPDDSFSEEDSTPSMEDKDSDYEA